MTSNFFLLELVRLLMGLVLVSDFECGKSLELFIVSVFDCVKSSGLVSLVKKSSFC